MAKGPLRLRNLDAHEGPPPIPILRLPAGVHLLLPLTQNPPTPITEGVEGLPPLLVPVDEPLGRHPLQHDPCSQLPDSQALHREHDRSSTQRPRLIEQVLTGQNEEERRRIDWHALTLRAPATSRHGTDHRTALLYRNLLTCQHRTA